MEARRRGGRGVAVVQLARLVRVLDEAAAAATSNCAVILMLT